MVGFGKASCDDAPSSAAKGKKSLEEGAIKRKRKIEIAEAIQATSLKSISTSVAPSTNILNVTEIRGASAKRRLSNFNLHPHEIIQALLLDMKGSGFDALSGDSKIAILLLQPCDTTIESVVTILHKLHAKYAENAGFAGMTKLPQTVGRSPSLVSYNFLRIGL